MKYRILFFGIILFISSVFNSNSQKNELPVLKGPYLGQKPPGMTPELFAPSVISTSESKEFASTFSPDGNEFYFTRSQNRKQRIWYTKQRNGGWSVPEIVPFGSDYPEFEPHISPDGNKLYFSSQRPRIQEDTLKEGFDIWVTINSNNTWSEPRYFGENMMYISAAADGSIYFTDLSDSERLFIAKREWNGKNFESMERLSDSVNCFSNSARPFIAPDECYLLFDGSMNGDFNTDLYVSFRRKNGEWTKAARLGFDVNTNKREICANVSPDGKYLFFSRFDKPDINIYWVDAKIIEELKPEELK